MASHQANAYRANAATCRTAAARSRYADIRDTYLSRAEQWEDMARQIEELRWGCSKRFSPAPRTSRRFQDSLWLR
jgi:hypothetical protein